MEENNEINLLVVGWKGMDWMDLAPDRDGWRALLSAVMKLRVPQNEGRFLNSLRNCYLLRKDSVLWS